MTQQELLSGIEKVQKIASASKLERMLANPVKYFRAIFFREIIYRRTRKSQEVQATTFFGFPMRILLPSATDICLTGGKSHPSEIRLAKYLIQNLRHNDSFLDIGAHYGYFSLLAAQLVGSNGRVTAFEASPSTFQVLKKILPGHRISRPSTKPFPIKQPNCPSLNSPTSIRSTIRSTSRNSGISPGWKNTGQQKSGYRPIPWTTS